MDWYTTYKIIKLAGLSADIQKIDLRSWALLHKHIADALGINPNKNIDDFIRLSKIIQELTDRNDELPCSEDVMREWLIQFPKNLPPKLKKKAII